MFKTDAREIIEDELMSVYRHGMTTEMLKKESLLKLTGLFESPVDYRVTSCIPGDEPNSITVTVERVDYT